MTEQKAPEVAVPVDLSVHAPLVQAYLNAVEEADRWDQIAGELKKAIQAAMGEATHATVNGKPAFTWKPVGKFSVARFKREMPELWRKYNRKQEVWMDDLEALREEHPDIFDRFRARVFNRVRG
jgi:hypothetical protein